MAGGDGIRFGGRKQFAELCGRPVVSFSVEVARSACSNVVLVVPAALDGADLGPVGDGIVVPGGATRSDSVRAGLSAVPDHVEIVVVHDAVRPLATLSLFEAVIDAVRSGADAAVPGIPVTDTLKRVVDDVVVSTLPRDEVVAVQTPQAFRASVLRRAHETSQSATDDASLVEEIGGTVRIVPGEGSNLKLTERGDVRIFEALMNRTGS